MKNSAAKMKPALFDLIHKLCAYAAPPVRRDRAPWCTMTGQMVHGDRRLGARSPHGTSLSDSFALPHGVAIDTDHIGIVHDPVTNSIS